MKRSSFFKAILGIAVAPKILGEINITPTNTHHKYPLAPKECLGGDLRLGDIVMCADRNKYLVTAESPTINGSRYTLHPIIMNEGKVHQAEGGELRHISRLYQSIGTINNRQD